MKNFAYFRNGMLYEVAPREIGVSLADSREVAYRADVIVSDGVMYDLSSIGDIQAMAIPYTKPTSNILELSYIMKIRCGAEKDAALIPAFVDKTIALMQASGFMWCERDYLQVIRNYYRVGLFADGDAYEKEFRLTHPRIFLDPGGEKAELENDRTKAYFLKKWVKKQKQQGLL